MAIWIELKPPQEIPNIPKDLVRPQIVAGVNALGRGQDVQALGQFLTTISQTMGPEAVAKYINPEEVVKRLAAAQGIDVLNLVRGMEEVQQEEQQAQQQAMEMERMKQTPNLLKAPVMDPSKNPQLAKEIEASGGIGPDGQPQGGPPPEDDFPVEQLT